MSAEQTLETKQLGKKRGSARCKINGKSMLRMFNQLKDIILSDSILTALCHSGKWIISSSYRKITAPVHPFFVDRFDRYLAIFMAHYIYWIFERLAVALRRRNIYFMVNNIYYAVGHVYPEIDWALRKISTGELGNSPLVVYLWPRSPVNIAFRHILQDNKNLYIAQSSLLHFLLYPLVLRYAYLALDTSQSCTNHFYHTSRYNIMPIPSGDISYRDTFQTRQTQYAICRSKNPELFPLKTEHTVISHSLKELIGSERYALLQIKTFAANATFNPTDPETYISTIRHLLSLGITPVMAGREKMPEAFRALGVINYSQSKHASSMNDYILASNAMLVVSSSSGFSCIPDTLDIPLISINNWQINGYVGRKTLNMPSLISVSGQLLRFQEQLEFVYAYSKYLSKGIIPPGIDLKVVDASEDQILRGVLELVDLVDTDFSKPFTSRQKIFRSLFPNDMMGYQLSRIPDSFLSENENLI